MPSTDVVWSLPWRGGGSESAVRGASEWLNAHGAVSVIADPAAALQTPARVYVLLGLNLDQAAAVRRLRPRARVVLQNHSPWTFLGFSRDDWLRWIRCLAWCREQGSDCAVGQVAEREYESAVDAWGGLGLCLLPAVYPYPVAAEPQAGLPRLLLAHKNRPWKNMAGQAVAAALLHRRTGMQCLWSLSPAGREAADIARIFGMLNGGAQHFRWLSQDDFRRLAARAAVGMCCTWAECYSQVALDYLAQGTPIVGSPAQWFCPPDWRAFPDHPTAIAAAAERILGAGSAARRVALAAARDAQARQHHHLQEWAAKWL